MKGEEYLARYRGRYEKLYAGDDLYHWATQGLRLFRAGDWLVTPLAGDPWRALYASPGEHVDWKASDQLDPLKSTGPGYRRHMYRRYWDPWLTLNRERNVNRLVLSVYERMLGFTFIGPRKGSGIRCAECDLEWDEIDAALQAVDYSIADCCAIFSMSDDWAMYCWEGFAILGGTAEYIARYGELAGGWAGLRADFQNHLHGDYEFFGYPNYRAAVESALSASNPAWSAPATRDTLGS